MSKKTKWLMLPSRRRFGCDNAGNPIVEGPASTPESRKRLAVQVGKMEPEIQAELDKILKDFPASGTAEE